MTAAAAAGAVLGSVPAAALLDDGADTRVAPRALWRSRVLLLFWGASGDGDDADDGDDEDDAYDYVLENENTRGKYDEHTRKKPIHHQTKNNETIEEAALNLFEFKHKHCIKETAMNTLFREAPIPAHG